MNAYPVFRLCEIADVVAGDPAPQDPGAFAFDGPLFVRMQDVGRHHVNPSLAASADRLSPNWLARNRLRLFPKDSILIPKSGASVNLNHRAKLATDAHVVSHLAVIMPDKSRIDPDYLFWWSVRYDPRGQMQVTSLPSLKLSTLKEARVPLPPLDEQRRIVSILNQAAKIERLRAQTQKRLREFIPALFIKMFGDPVGNPMGWVTASLGEVIEGFEGGRNIKEGNGESRFSILKVSAVTGGEFDPSMSKPAPNEYAPMVHHCVRVGDLLISRASGTSALVGATVMVDCEVSGVLLPDKIWRFLWRKNSLVEPWFVHGLFQNTTLRSKMSEMATGTSGAKNISQARLKTLPIVVPPLDRQRQYSRLIEMARSTIAVAELGHLASVEFSACLMSRLLGQSA